MLIELAGQLGLPPHTDRLHAELARIYAVRPKILVFDLSKVTFVSSLGIGIFAEANQAVRRNGGRVRFCCAQAQVMEVLERTRMTAIFEFADRLDAAFGEEG